MTTPKSSFQYCSNVQFKGGGVELAMNV